MKKVILSTILMILCISSCEAICNREDEDSSDILKPYEFCDDDFENKKIPNFDDFSFKTTEKFKVIFPTKIDGYSDGSEYKVDEQKWFETIRLTYKNRGANFAGHYLIAERDCGSSCQLNTIVDLSTGQTYRPFPIALVISSINPLSENVCTKLGFKCNEEVLGFKKNSNLLIVMGSLGEETKKRGIYFFQWKNNKLSLLKKIEKTYKS